MQTTVPSLPIELRPVEIERRVVLHGLLERAMCEFGTATFRFALQFMDAVAGQLAPLLKQSEAPCGSPFHVDGATAPLGGRLVYAIVHRHDAFDVWMEGGVYLLLQNMAEPNPLRFEALEAAISFAHELIEAPATHRRAKPGGLTCAVSPVL